MKTNVSWLLAISFAMAALIAGNNAKAQDFSGSDGSKATYNEQSKSYDLLLVGISQKKAVDLVVDQLKSRCEQPQTVAGYILTYKDKLYTVEYEDKNRDGWPQTFTSITDVRKKVAADLKWLLQNL